MFRGHMVTLACFVEGQVARTERSGVLEAGAYDKDIWNLPPHPLKWSHVAKQLHNARAQIGHHL